MKRSLTAATLAAAGVALYAKFVRPRMLRWGSNECEWRRSWAGDELLPQHIAQSTHAITISAPPRRVWPWLAQIGQDRGGFYSYTPLENLALADMRNAKDIHLEWQHRWVGDKVWLANPARYHGSACMVVARWIPGRSLVLVPSADWDRIRGGQNAQAGVWSFHLVPLDGGRKCRLVARILVGTGLPGVAKAVHFAFWEPAHAVMQMAMLRGIKRRAESSANANALEVCA